MKPVITDKSKRVLMPFKSIGTIKVRPRYMEVNGSIITYEEWLELMHEESFQLC